MLPGLPAPHSSQCVNHRPGSDPSRRHGRGLTPGRGCAALVFGALLLLLPPGDASRGSTGQNPASSTPSDPARVERAARQEKAREIQRDAAALLKRAATAPSESA